MTDYERGVADGKADVQNGVQPSTAAWMFSHDDYWRGYRAGRLTARLDEIGVTDHTTREPDGFVGDYEIGFQDGAQDAERGVMDQALYYGADEYARGYKVGFRSTVLRHLLGAQSLTIRQEDVPDELYSMRRIVAGEKIPEGNPIYIRQDGSAMICVPAETVCHAAWHGYRLLAALAFVLVAFILAGSVQA